MNEQEAARWWLKGAQAGHVTAMVDVAYTYREGRGNPKDLAEALRWYQAASNISRDAQYQYVHSQSQSLRERCNTSRLREVRVYAKGCALTLHRLGNMYNRGLGVPANEALAFVCFQKAAQAVCVCRGASLIAHRATPRRATSWLCVTVWAAALRWISTSRSSTSTRPPSLASPPPSTN